MESIPLVLDNEFRYRISNSDDSNTYELGAFEGGSTSVFLKRKEKYDFEVSINGKWHVFQITTDPNKINSFLLGQDYDGYFKVKNLEIKERNSDDDDFYIHIDLEADDSFCSFFDF